MSRAWTSPQQRRGATLVETLLALSVLSIGGLACVPLLSAAADVLDAFGAASRTVDHAAYALDRVGRLLREAPAGVSSGEIAVASALPGEVVFENGAGLRLAGGDLWLVSDGEPDAPLCRDVTAFVIEYIGADGVSDVSATPELTHRFHITLETADVRLRSAFFVRTRIGT